MKMISILSFLIFMSATSFANEAVCSNPARISSGVDSWPWSLAKPFPWDNIQGYWKLSNTEHMTFLKARILSSTSQRKILSLSFYGDSICSAKAYAKGTGFIDTAEKNVVTALISDGTYRYQVKLGMFDTQDLPGNLDMCGPNIMAASMQIIEKTKSSEVDNEPLDSSATQVHNVMLKKVSEDPISICKKNK